MSTDTDPDDAEVDPNADARERLVNLAADLYDQLDGGDVPRLTLPTRTKGNIEYD
ncbi:DNA topoisomerase VI, partial [Halobacteriales archaeon SW_7_68_16]